MKQLTVLLVLFYYCHFSFAQEPKLVLPIGHTEYLTGALVSPDNKYLVTASEDNTGKIWNYRTGKFMYDLVLHTANICALQMSSDGSFVVLASEDGSYSKWETATGKLLFQSRRKAAIRDAILLKGDTSVLLMKDYVMVIGGFTEMSGDEIFDEIYEYYPNDTKKRMALSPDGKRVAIHQKKRDLKIFDLVDSKQQTGFYRVQIDSSRYFDMADIDPEQLFFSSNNQLIGTWGGYFMAGFDLTSGKQNFYYPAPVYQSVPNKDKSLFCFKNGKDDSIRVWDATINRIKFILPNEKKLSVVKFKEDGSGLILLRDKLVQEWSVNGQLITERNLEEAASRPMLLNEKSNIALTGIKNGIQTVDWTTGKLINEFSGKIASVKNSSLSHDGQWLFEVKEQYANYWQLSRMKTERFPVINNEVVKKIHLTHQKNQLLLQYTNSIVFFDCSNARTIYKMESGFECQVAIRDPFFYTTDRGMVKKWDLHKGTLLAEWEINKTILSPVFSPNDSLFAFRTSYGNHDSIYVWNIPNKQLIATYYRPGQHTGEGFVKIYTPNYTPVLRFSPDSKQPYFGTGEDGFISIAQLPYYTTEKYDEFTDTMHVDSEMLYEEGTMRYLTEYLPVAFSKKDSLCFISQGSEIDTYDVLAMDYHQNIRYRLSYSDFQRIIYLDEAAKLLHTATRTEWLIWDLKKQKLLRKITLPMAMAAIAYIPASRQLLVQSHDRIALMDSENKKPTYFFSTLDNTETIAYRSDRFYKAGPSVARWFSWNLDDKFYDFDQWDLQYNRPDKLMELAAEPDQTLQQAYYNAYTKRLSRNRLSEDDMNSDLSLPQTHLLNKEKDGDMVLTDSITLQLNLRPASRKQPIKNVLVSVNDNPVWGRSGYALQQTNQKTIAFPLTIKLSAGINRIKVSCTDAKGRESLREQLIVKHAPADPAPVKTWFIGIGINRFADSIHNLLWSVKDIRDLAIKLSQKNGDAISIDTLFDESVTIENIRSLKAKLLQTRVDDRLIIAYSGHGLLSKTFDYYLSTYSVDFKDPGQLGLPYEELENLADGIPARKKLLLIDACHSGELDKEEMLKVQQVGNTVSTAGVKGVQPLSAAPAGAKMGMKNSFQLMQELFTNSNNSTGATIIAAAAGTQFALERNSLKNGIFTYAILEMMQQQFSITISALHEYLSKRVTELTNGLQVPTARKQNTADDWKLW